MNRLILRRWLRRQAVRLGLAVLAPLAALVAWGQRPFQRPVGEVRKLLVIRLDLLGDVALSLPAVRALRAGYPAAEIVFLVRPAAAPIAARCPAVDRVLTFDPDALRPSGRPFAAASWRVLFATLHTIRTERFDLVVGLFGVWASVFAIASAAPWRVGYRGEGFPGAYSHSLSGRRYRPVQHEVAWCLRLAQQAGGRLPAPAPDLQVTPADRAAARAVLVSAGWDGRPLVVLSPGAVAGAAKRWTPTGWAALADWLHTQGIAVALVGTSSERPLAAPVLAAAQHPPLDLVGRTSLPTLLGVLALASLVVSGDSGPLHLAEALGTPVVALHGPSDPRISGPRRGAVVRLDLPCSPCYDATYPAECPLGHHRCMRDLSAEQVIAAVAPRLPIRTTVRP
jgi:lipopolysaccharide heptosyltransferase II